MEECINVLNVQLMRTVWLLLAYCLLYAHCCPLYVHCMRTAYSMNTVNSMTTTKPTVNSVMTTANCLLYSSFVPSGPLPLMTTSMASAWESASTEHPCCFNTICTFSTPASFSTEYPSNHPKLSTRTCLL